MFMWYLSLEGVDFSHPQYLIVSVAKCGLFDACYCTSICTTSLRFEWYHRSTDGIHRDTINSRQSYSIIICIQHLGPCKGWYHFASVICNSIYGSYVYITLYFFLDSSLLATSNQCKPL